MFAFPDVRPIANCVGDDIALPVAFDQAECVLDMTSIPADCLQILGAGTDIEHDAFEFAALFIPLAIVAYRRMSVCGRYSRNWRHQLE